MKVYLAGPMNGYPLYNYEAFEGATRLLRRSGVQVVSPHEQDIENGWVVVERDETGNGFTSVELSDTFDRHKVMHHDLHIILNEVDAVVCLPGWRESPGALAEVSAAQAVGVPVNELVPGAGDESWDLVHIDRPRPEPEPAHPGGVNPKDLVGDTKAPLHLVPPAALIAAAQAIQNGARKYGPYNWRDYPVQAHAYYAAVLRHITAWWDGEDLDPESGQSHLGHVVAGLAILIDSFHNGTVIDDRPKSGPSAAMLRGADAANSTGTVAS